MPHGEDIEAARAVRVEHEPTAGHFEGGGARPAGNRHCPRVRAVYDVAVLRQVAQLDKVVVGGEPEEYAGLIQPDRLIRLALHRQGEPAGETYSRGSGRDLQISGGAPHIEGRGNRVTHGYADRSGVVPAHDAVSRNVGQLDHDVAGSQGTDCHHVIQSNRRAQSLVHHHGVPIGIEILPTGGGDHRQGALIGDAGHLEGGGGCIGERDGENTGVLPLESAVTGQDQLGRSIACRHTADDGDAIRGDRLIPGVSQHQGKTVGYRHPARRHRYLDRSDIRDASYLETAGQITGPGGHGPGVGPGQCAVRGNPRQLHDVGTVRNALEGDRPARSDGPASEVLYGDQVPFGGSVESGGGGRDDEVVQHNPGPVI